MGQKVNLKFITRRLGEALEVVIRRGWRCPIYVAVIAVSGSMINGRYDYDGDTDRLKGKVLSQWFDPSSGFKLPINIMLVDSNGQAARVFIKSSDEKPEILN